VTVRVVAPGRVNLIGEHTDYTGGLVMPMAIDRYTEITGSLGGDRVRLASRDEVEPLDLPLRVDDPATAEPAWARYVAGVVAELQPATGFEGSVGTTIPIGAGLSSSHALQVAVGRLQSTPGVFGARMTGGGFGGCVVALAAPGALTDGWIVHAVGGARVDTSEGAQE